jgi:type II secretory pathway component PulF
VAADGTGGRVAGGGRWYLRTPRGAENWDKIKLRLPVIGPVVRAAALGRFARTLGTLAKSGVSLLPALKIVENTIGNRCWPRRSRKSPRKRAAAIRWPRRCASWAFFRARGADD